MVLCTKSVACGIYLVKPLTNRASGLADTEAICAWVNVLCTKSHAHMQTTSQASIQSLIRLIISSGGVNVGISDGCSWKNKSNRWQETEEEMNVFSLLPALRAVQFTHANEMVQIIYLSVSGRYVAAAEIIAVASLHNVSTQRREAKGKRISASLLPTQSMIWLRLVVIQHGIQYGSLAKNLQNVAHFHENQQMKLS